MTQLLAALAAVLIVVGVALVSIAAALIVAGALLAVWTALFVYEVADQ